MARPTIYSDDLGERIAELIEEGKSLRQIDKLEGMPAASTVHKWLSTKDHPFVERHARARQIQGLTFGDMLIEIVAGVLNGAISPNQGKVAGNKLQWLAERMYPKLYGAKSQIGIAAGPGQGQIAGVLIVTPTELEERWEQRYHQTPMIEGEVSREA